MKPRAPCRPYFSNHWFMRFSEPVGIGPDELAPLDAIIGGHRVLDHWQPGSLAGYCHPTADIATLTATSGMARRARRAGFTSADRLPWGETRALGDGLEVTSLRGDRVTGMTTSHYLLETPRHRVYVGTEARSLATIRRNAELVGRATMDVAVLPINGARLLGRRLVMTAEIASRAADELGASHFVPIHYTQRPLPPLLSCRVGVDHLRPPHVGQLHVGAAGQPIVIDDRGREMLERCPAR